MKYIVLDFNGTIIDDVDVSLECLNNLRDKLLNLEPLCLDEYRHIFTFPIIDYYKRAGFDFKDVSFEEVGKMWVDLYLEKVRDINLMDDILSFLKKHKDSYHFIILSASKKEMIIDDLNRLGIIDYFDEVLGIDNIYAHGKLEIAKAYFKDKKLSDYLLIGDTLHDAEVAKSVGINYKLVAKGHQAIDVLEEESTEIYHNISDIVL